MVEHADNWMAILFGGLAMIAQYLPARWGVPIGLLAVLLSVWQLGWGGWPLLLAMALIALVVWRILRGRGLLEKEQSHAHRDEAIVIHRRIIDLTNKLWETASKSGFTEDLMDNLQTELNNLGGLINSREFDQWAEDLMRTYAQFLECHMPVHDMNGEWARARINTRFRDYIRKVRG